MLRTILVRVLSAVGILLVVSVLVFFGMAAMPGDAARAVLGRQATPELLAQFRAEHGLDRPLLQQYGDWFTGLLHGDFGASLVSGEPVTTVLGIRFGYTLALAVGTAAILIPLALLLGIWSATRATKPTDQIISLSTLTFISMPEFVIGAFLIALLAVAVRVFPATSLIDPYQSVFAQLNNLALPVITLVLTSAAQATRMIRATMIDVLRSEFVQMAELKGVPRRRILFKHALPNAMGPTLQIFAFTLAYLVGGVITVEILFGYPGLGSAFVDAVRIRDLTTVEAMVMLGTALYVLLILAADIGAIILNPRLRRRA
ncbi:ABC transporter permease [Kribbella speibonae]|uniref:ABC transporter permease n=1 Tax=Kribbella speibonae TaxID=1572660 RepID=A0A4R0IRP6_9ACTN|nr:ABC transporter permease [Kribbella speibonae]TCC36471.1 ABC transporter permease [Kribbella speibonae]